MKKQITQWVNGFKKDLHFYNENTEILAIWTVLFMIIAGTFVLLLNSTIVMGLMLFVFIIAFSLLITVFSVYYLYAIKYHNKKKILPKLHGFFNKSFKLRTLLTFIKIPSFRYLIRRNFKFAS